jgi:hypothetical protein
MGRWWRPIDSSMGPPRRGIGRDRTPDIGVWERSATSDTSTGTFEGLRWMALGVDVFSGAVGVRILLTGSRVGDYPSRFLGALTAAGSLDQLFPALGGVAANAFSAKTKSMVLIAWFQRQSGEPLESLTVECGGHRVTLF